MNFLSIPPDPVTIISIISFFALILAIISNLFNIRDRFIKGIKNLRKSKHKRKYRPDNPDFQFRIGHVSNTPPGKCNLTVQFLNLSNEVKFIEPLFYNYEFKNNKNKYVPPITIIDHQKWPKRLEHGQRFALSVDFHHMLNNGIYEYWKKEVQVFATCKSTTGDLLRSNSIDFDILAEHLIPLSENNKKLAADLKRKYNSSLRNIEGSLWQLQIFGRISSHIVLQLEKEKIPIMQYLTKDLELVLKDNNTLYEMYKELEQRKIPPSVIEKYLQSLIE